MADAKRLNEAIEAAKHYCTLTKNEDDKKKVSALLADTTKAESQEKLLAYFNDRIEFGTAGLRGLMAPGHSNMNDLVIAQTAQGIQHYIAENCSSHPSKAVVIGYDGRRNSKRWAMMSAHILTSAGHPVFLHNDVMPTPYLAFGTRHFGTVFGIMVTASHNPKDDNGYKVYFQNGAQIISPMDKHISACIKRQVTPIDTAWQFEQVFTHSLIKDPMPELEQAYIKAQLKSIHFNESKVNASVPIRVVYTAMHGVGLRPVQNIIKAFGFPDSFLVPVPEQCAVDPEFPTVKFPNPEEKKALDLAQKFAERENLKVIFANDPDADRLAVAERLPSGTWLTFTGNQLGALLGHWIWRKWRAANPEYDLGKVYMMSSTVSSRILETIARKEGFNFIETLTGFKWMGNEADRLYKADPKNKVIFAFEEAIGFMCGDAVLDKDGVGALAVAAELVADVYGRGETLAKCLDQVFATYGMHLSLNSYYISHDKARTDAMFSRLRRWPDPGSAKSVLEGKAQYPRLCGQYEIEAVRDLTIDYDDDYPQDGFKARLPVSASSHAITFRFACGVMLTLRTSGTEPKIKYYSELRGKPGSSFDLAEAERQLADVIQSMVTHFYEPEKNGFKAAAS